MSNEFSRPMVHDWFLPMYDMIQVLTMPEHDMKVQLIRDADIVSGHKVLDVGCGTGTAAILCKQKVPLARVYAIDPDEHSIALAKRKAGRTGVEVEWINESAHRMPFSDESFDRVLSSFMFHHLTTDMKHLALREIYRILRPGGRLSVLDWGPLGASWFARKLVRVLHPGRRAADNVDGKLFRFMSENGFRTSELRRWRWGIVTGGSASYYEGVKPIDPSVG